MCYRLFGTTAGVEHVKSRSEMARITSEVHVNGRGEKTTSARVRKYLKICQNWVPNVIYLKRKRPVVDVKPQCRNQGMELERLVANHS